MGYSGRLWYLQHRYLYNKRKEKGNEKNEMKKKMQAMYFTLDNINNSKTTTK